MIEQSTHEFIKDLVQEISIAAAIIGGAITAIVAIRQLRLSTEQRKSELRWKQALTAKELVNDIHSNEWADLAVEMFDWSEGNHKITFQGEIKEKISYEKNVINALKKQQGECSDFDRHIVRSFDWFFYFIDRIEHYISTGLIEFEDVKPIFFSYHKKIQKHETIFQNFMEVNSYYLAVSFWKRYNR